MTVITVNKRNIYVMLPVNIITKVRIRKVFISIAVVSIGNPGSKEAPKKVVVLR